MANETNFFDETEFLLDLESPNHPKTVEPKKPGKKKHEVWNYFIEEETRKAGHSSSTCVYCGDIRDRGRIPDMMTHLALQYEKVKASVKEKYLRILAQNNQSYE